MVTMTEQEIKQWQQKMRDLHAEDWVQDEDGNVECYDCTNPVSMDEVYGNPTTSPRCEDCYYNNK